MNGIPVRRIFRITWIGTLAVLLLTFLLGGSAPMLINGENYADWLWLKLSDMFVITSLLMLVAGIGAVCFGATRYTRKNINSMNEMSAVDVVFSPGVSCCFLLISIFNPYL